MGLLTCSSYGKALQHYTCKQSGHGFEFHCALKCLGLLHLRKRPYKSMPYIILLMHLVSHKRFIYYTNVFVIRYSVMLLVGSCQHTEVQLMQCSVLSKQGVLMGFYQVSTLATYLTLSLVIFLFVFVPRGAMQIIYLFFSLKD